MRCALVAGETSGDLLAGLLLQGLAARGLGGVAQGIGGPAMARHGFEAWWSHEKLAVHGLGWDVLRRYPEIVGIRRQLKARLLANPPDVFIGVDAPDFNLTLEADLRGRGIRTVHFVCPSIWAWRPERVYTLQSSCDHVLCVFPFEPALLARHGVAATYVGHPLASVIPVEPDRAAARRQLGLALDGPVVAVLPGSRNSEVRYLGPLYWAAVARMAQVQPALRFVVPSVPSQVATIARQLHEVGLSARVQVLNGQSHTALAACDVVLVASGTATLEAALFKRPMVIAYRMSALSWALMQRKRLQPWVGLPNILCGEFVVPELLQDAATPAALAAAVLGWLDTAQRQPETIRALEARFTALHHSLFRDTPALAAHAIENVLAT
ncbi:MAG: lipid-A-disaccharide synthase [Rhodoferax sp.]